MIQYTTCLNFVGSCDVYELHKGICRLPSNFMPNGQSASWTITVGETTRSVCRQLCSKIYDLQCSGFLYSREDRSCLISPYTGEWVTAETQNACNVLASSEFYRRIRYATGERMARPYCRFLYHNKSIIIHRFECQHG